MWIDSRTALKGLGILTYPRCCEFQTTAVDSSGQAYDSKGYCTLSEAMGGNPGAVCENQIVPNVSNMTLYLIGGALLLITLFSMKK